MSAVLRIGGRFGILSVCLVQSVFAFNFENTTKRPYDEKADEQGEAAVDYGEIVKEDTLDGDTASEQIQDEFGIAYDAPDEQRATFYIKEALNRFLAITWLVALAVLLYGFYKMFASGDNEEAMGDARKIVIGATIALLAIGVSRFIISRFFEIFFQVKEGVAQN